MKELIAYFSRGGENYVNGELKKLDIGNTEIAADILQKITNADLFKIEPKTPYSDNYNECVDEAMADKKSNIRPKLVALPDHIEHYDVIYLGYPNYWESMPMAVFTFLESFDFTKKTIYPFCTHEGSGFGTSIEDIKKCCPHSTVGNGLAIYGYQASQAELLLKSWCEN